MKPATLWGVALCCLSPVLAVERKTTASKERLWDMDSHIQAAAKDLRLPLSLLPAGERSDYRIYLQPRFQSAASMRLYQKVTGRNEDVTLELYDPRGQRTVVFYDFRMEPDTASKRRAAREFIRLVKQHLSGLTGP